MKLRNKLLLAVGLAWLFFLVIIYAGSEFILKESFLTLEAQSNERNLQRLDAAMTQAKDSLSIFTTDWAHWGNVYGYMEGADPGFVRSDITKTALLGSTIDFLLLWNTNKEFNWGTSINSQQQMLSAPPSEEKRKVYFGSSSPLVYQANPNASYQGYIILDNEIYLVAAAPIIDASKTKPIIGTITTGRRITENFVTGLENLVRLNLKLFVLSDAEKNPKIKADFIKTINHNGHYLSRDNEFNYQSYTLIRDINDHPIGMIQISGVRLTYLSGLKAIHYWLVSFIILGLVIALILMHMIRRLVLDPLDKLSSQVSEIGEFNEIKRRITVQGNDELSSVANKINTMLEIIQGTNEALEHRVEERTEELMKANKKLSEEMAERKSVEQELLVNKEHLIQLSHYDTLTALPNRVFFNEILNKALNNARTNKKKLAVILLDLDRFKNINDTLGQPTGDLVLKEIAYRYSTLVRSGDVIARLGGDQFIVLLTDISDPNIISQTCEKFLAQSTKPIKINIHDFFVTVSMGVCIFPDDGAALEELERNADVAMHKAKHQGGNIYQYFAKEMNFETGENVVLEAALRRAIDNKEFILNFQPKINLQTGNIVGIEALLRWDSPELGAVSPSKFIPFAEESGMILEIGEWVLRQACFINKSWQMQGYAPIPIAVNLSAKQFWHADIVQQLQAVLQESKLEPRYFEIEIHEKTVMDNIESAIIRLNALKNLGVLISLDNFGMGYTSISHLKRFPIDFLKIDQTFVKGLPESQDDIAIVRGAIALAHSLDLKVNAEGVETPEQMQLLSTYHCDDIQGYFISRPLSERKIILLFSNPDTKITP